MECLFENFQLTIEQSEAVAPYDTDAFLKLMQVGTPAQFGDLKAQANRIDPQVRLATEFSNFSWNNTKGEAVIRTAHRGSLPPTIEGRDLLPNCPLKRLVLLLEVTNASKSSI